MSSFLDDIVNVGSSIWDWATGSSISAGTARAAGLAYLLKEVQDSINKDNARPEKQTTYVPDYGVREQIDPDTEHKIPVVYGTAVAGGAITDAVMTNSNQTMWYCITLSEQTGVIYGTNQQSQISFEAVYWNETQVNFRSNGITATSLTDDNGNASSDIDGLVEFYFFSGGSNKPVKLSGYSQGNGQAANQLFPGWTTSHTMNDLVFALVKVTYNKEKNITGLGNIQFKLKNTMSQPGDCLYDYMTNTRYGAGITPEEIYSE
jgi:hypothetical protein